MRIQLARDIALFLMLATSAVSAAALSDSFQRGKNYYFAGEFEKAISQFESTAKTNPGGAEPYLWLGKSYAVQADIKGPILGGRARLKARIYLAKAVQLAPDSIECRRELFDFLVNSDASFSALQEAKSLLDRMPESDPEFPWMQLSLMEARAEHASPEYLTSALFTWPPQALARIAVKRAESVHERR
jgi:tetratricopeptide (TPR) repeat protein